MSSFQNQSTRDLIMAALRLIGVATQGNDPTPYEINQGLYALNEIIDSWNIDGKMIVSMGFHTFPVGNSVQTYTIGPGGDFDVPARPAMLEYAAFQSQTTTPPIDIPLSIANVDEWAGIVSKLVVTTIPTTIYMDEQYPLAHVNLWPIPSDTGNIVLTYWEPLNSGLTLDTAFSMPPAYARGLRYDLAIMLAPEFGKSAPSEIIGALAEIKNNIGVANIRPSRVAYDAAVLGGGAYNVFTDQVQG